MLKMILKILKIKIILKISKIKVILKILILKIKNSPIAILSYSKIYFRLSYELQNIGITVFARVSPESIEYNNELQRGNSPRFANPWKQLHKCGFLSEMFSLLRFLCSLVKCAFGSVCFSCTRNFETIEILCESRNQLLSFNACLRTVHNREQLVIFQT